MVPGASQHDQRSSPARRRISSSSLTARTSARAAQRPLRCDERPTRTKSARARTSRSRLAFTQLPPGALEREDDRERLVMARDALRRRQRQHLVDQAGIEPVFSRARAHEAQVYSHRHAPELPEHGDVTDQNVKRMVVPLLDRRRVSIGRFTWYSTSGTRFASAFASGSSSPVAKGHRYGAPCSAMPSGLGGTR